MEPLSEKDSALMAHLLKLLLQAQVVLDLLTGVAVTEDGLVSRQRLLQLFDAVFQEFILLQKPILLEVERVHILCNRSVRIALCLDLQHLGLHLYKPAVKPHLLVGVLDMRLQLSNLLLTVAMQPLQVVDTLSREDDLRLQACNLIFQALLLNIRISLGGSHLALELLHSSCILLRHGLHLLSQLHVLINLCLETAASFLEGAHHRSLSLLGSMQTEFKPTNLLLSRVFVSLCCLQFLHELVNGLLGNFLSLLHCCELLLQVFTVGNCKLLGLCHACQLGVQVVTAGHCCLLGLRHVCKLGVQAICSSISSLFGLRHDCQLGVQVVTTGNRKLLGLRLRLQLDLQLLSVNC
mmetsp:Transcript_18095/g.50627  ORF Transcript_18095/g.50627 Transcript_18095/m.50627 type:complete len:351 (-) Transcript_18095:555-1607(-)